MENLEDLIPEEQYADFQHIINNYTNPPQESVLPNPNFFNDLIPRGQFGLVATERISPGEIVTRLPVLCFLFDPLKTKPKKATLVRQYEKFLKNGINFEKDEKSQLDANLHFLRNGGNTKFSAIFNLFDNPEEIPPIFKAIVPGYGERDKLKLHIIPDVLDYRFKNELSGWFVGKSSDDEQINVNCQLVVENGRAYMDYVSKREILPAEEIIISESVGTMKEEGGAVSTAGLSLKILAPVLSRDLVDRNFSRLVKNNPFFDDLPKTLSAGTGDENRREQNLSVFYKLREELISLEGFGYPSAVKPVIDADDVADSLTCITTKLGYMII